MAFVSDNSVYYYLIFFCAKLKFYFLEPTDPNKKNQMESPNRFDLILLCLFLFIYLTVIEEKRYS